MERALECPICLDRFTYPKVLPCQHTFCNECLQGVVEGYSVRCPECRKVHFVPPDGFQTNVAVQRMLDSHGRTAPSDLGRPEPFNTGRPEPSDPSRPEPTAPTLYTIEGSGPETAATAAPTESVGDRNEDESCSCPCCLTKCVGWTRRTIRRVLKRFLHDHYREKKIRGMTAFNLTTNVAC
ncbi:E3 ubiquitin-protein ligase SH3RF3-like [Mya arenaria]|uniref:E3 ubiquitin-protein ligase SH3RF3-like n=1 Tax=Mya arenaria TaxID=6604 RepID=UPI0022DF8EA7|nr:E3 ubiquitin-protein ligase SH3RF3-like [Mya arenaria]